MKTFLISDLYKHYTFISIIFYYSKSYILFVSVTTKFPSTLLTAEGTKSANTSVMVEEVPTAGEWNNGASSEVACSEK